MTTAVTAFYQKRGVHHGITGNWTRFFNEIDVDGSGRLTLEEVDSAIRGKLKAEISRYELRVFWRRLDVDNSGLVSPQEFVQLMYRADLATWPDVNLLDLEATVCKLNTAADKWHHSGGNWFKLFKGMDSENSGRVSFDEVVKYIRGPFPGLQLRNQSDVSDLELKGLWRALDIEGGMDVSTHRFMHFMRKHSGGISMHRLTSYSKKKRGIDESGRDFAGEIAAAPQLEVKRAREVAARLALALHVWLVQRGLTQGTAAQAPSPEHWQRLFDFADSDKSGRLSYAELEVIVRNTLKTAKDITDDELKAFWRIVDPDGSGEATAGEFGGAVYRLHLEEWPTLDAEGLERCVAVLNAAADKWHRCGGNWYKVFAKVDTDGSGQMDFAEMVSFVRKPFPCLSLKLKELSDDDIRALWRGLDLDRSGSISSKEFTAFMRQHGKAFAMHRLTEYSKQKRGLIEDKKRIGPAPLRTRQQLQATAATLDKAIAKYWAARGVHVNMEGTWERFFNQADTDGSGRLTFAELESELRERLAAPTNAALREIGKASSKQKRATAVSKGVDAHEDNLIIKGVTHGDLHALWEMVDCDGSGEVVGAEWRLCMYRLDLETWPEPDDAILAHVVDTMNHAAAKWHRAGGNWYKVFRIVDSDNSGSMGFSELCEIVYRGLPCLALTKKQISIRDLQAFWKALDTDLSGEASLREFMVFMRGHAAKTAPPPRPEAPRMAYSKGAREVLVGASNKMLGRVASSAATVVTHPLSPQHAALLSSVLEKETVQNIKQAYASWGLPWTSRISEWDLAVVIRSALRVTEDMLDDDALHALWCALDRAGTGDVAVEDLLGIVPALQHMAVGSPTSKADAKPSDEEKMRQVAAC